MLECLLISVDHALILVFLASNQANCLIVSDRVDQILAPNLNKWLLRVINFAKPKQWKGFPVSSSQHTKI
ncbi:hypothetical protein I8748_14060 [Nostoc sp. CENA67]|uniref:Uncharacterized protein n=1 Tax=Amazonocrinis nigriterrae CENA67 TaxID=2794033 RepID=A0A8J7HTM7_9NOST|nr:hypothetical protein [Amazonocrinis nigriterrae]MBH8563297.1 hypothetical protein [Amazonocrinis nigriterrae CENA67]